MAAGILHQHCSLLQVFLIAGQVTPEFVGSKALPIATASAPGTDCLERMG